MTTEVASQFLNKECQFKLHDRPVRALSWAPNGRWFGSCSAEGIHIWNAASIANDSRPRFFLRPPSDPTSLSWNADGSYIACGCENGEYSVWDSQQFDLIRDSGPQIKSAVRCLAWSPASTARLALGGTDRVVHFESVDGGSRRWREQGFGHTSTIVSMAWSPDGKSVVTGTEMGTIGLWHPFGFAIDGPSEDSASSAIRTIEADNHWAEHYGLHTTGSQRVDVRHPLTHIVSASGIRAHGRAVTALAWAHSSGTLASGSLDGTVRLWSVDGSARDEPLQFDNPILHLEFSYGDRFLIIQTSESIAFSLSDRLGVVLEFKHRSHHDYKAPTRNCGLVINRDARMAMIDTEDPCAAQVWKVNFPALFAKAHQKHRPYHAIGVSLFGEPYSGKSSLARAVADVSEATTLDSCVYSVRTSNVPIDGVAADDDNTEVREIVLWDTTGPTEHPIIQRIQVGDCSVALIVLPTISGVALCDSFNISRWQETIRSCRSVLPREIDHCFAVVTRCSQVVPPPSDSEIDRLASMLRIDRIFLTCAESGTGISTLKQVLLSEISWARATSFWSSEALSELEVFARQSRSGSSRLCSVPQFQADFFRTHPLAGEMFKGDSHFREALRILELKGKVRFFETNDHVVLDPVHYRNYASSIVLAAQKDKSGMGRLPLAHLRSGLDHQIVLDPSHRLPAFREHLKLLSLSMEEMLEAKVAQTVSTDGISYLVFPRTLTRTRDESEPRPPTAASCKISGAVDDIFSALIVRLLGQRVHYPRESLWRNEASFDPASGGQCNIMISPSDDNLEATVALSFSPSTSETEKTKFLELVTDHFATSPNTVFEGMEALEPPPSAAEIPTSNRGVVGGASAGDDVTVFLSWRQDSDIRVEKNVQALAAQLRHDMRVIGDNVVRLGTTDAECADRVKHARVALFLFAKRPSVEHLKEYQVLESSGARIIPVILPSAPKSLEVPRELKNWPTLDLRGQFLDASALREGILNAWHAGPIQRKRETGHVFLSYFKEDVKQVSELVSDLQSAGHKVWWDQDSSSLSPGANWDHQLRVAIRQSYACVVCLPPILRSESWVYQEMALAIEQQRRMARDRTFIIPVRLGECDIQEFFDLTAGSDLRLQHMDYFGRKRDITKLDAVLVRAREAGSHV